MSQAVKGSPQVDAAVEDILGYMAAFGKTEARNSSEDLLRLMQSECFRILSIVAQYHTVRLLQATALPGGKRRRRKEPAS